MTACVRACGARGRRPCPALGGSICPTCCGRYRLVEIDCPRDCPYLEGEAYQADRRQERGIRKGSDYLRSRLRLFPGEDRLRFALAVEERIHRFVRGRGGVPSEEIAGALDALRARLRGIEVAAIATHPLARDLLDALRVPEGALSDRAGPDATTRAEVVARLAEDARSRAGKTPGYLELLRPYFEELADPRLRGRDGRGPGPRRTEGGIVLP